LRDLLVVTLFTISQLERISSPRGRYIEVAGIKKPASSFWITRRFPSDSRELTAWPICGQQFVLLRAPVRAWVVMYSQESSHLQRQSTAMRPWDAAKSRRTPRETSTTPKIVFAGLQADR